MPSIPGRWPARLPARRRRAEHPAAAGRSWFWSRRPPWDSLGQEGGPESFELLSHVPEGGLTDSRVTNEIDRDFLEAPEVAAQARPRPLAPLEAQQGIGELSAGRADRLRSGGVAGELRVQLSPDTLGPVVRAHADDGAQHPRLGLGRNGRGASQGLASGDDLLIPHPGENIPGCPVVALGDRPAREAEHALRDAARRETYGEPRGLSDVLAVLVGDSEEVPALEHA